MYTDKKVVNKGDSFSIESWLRGVLDSTPFEEVYFTISQGEESLE